MDTMEATRTYLVYQFAKEVACKVEEKTKHFLSNKIVDLKRKLQSTIIEAQEIVNTNNRKYTTLCIVHTFIVELDTSIINVQSESLSHIGGLDSSTNIVQLSLNYWIVVCQ